MLLYILENFLVQSITLRSNYEEFMNTVFFKSINSFSNHYVRNVRKNKLERI